MAKKMSRPEVGKAHARIAKKTANRLRKMPTEEADRLHREELNGHAPRKNGTTVAMERANAKKANGKHASNGEAVDHIKTYETHGIDFYRVDGDEHKCECPFCGKKAMSVNAKEGFFKCWDCSRSGNRYTFLQLFYDQCFDATTPAQLKKLAKHRKLPVEAFEMAEVAWDAERQRWIVPVRNLSGSMVNLRHVELYKKLPDDKKPFFMNTGGCKVHLYNQERIGHASTIFLCEGEWDCMAMEWLLLQNKAKDCASVAVPGADTFKEEWASIFTDKIVYIVYDNDEAGDRGIIKVADILRKHARCREIHSIKWPDSFPNKFDIRDLVGKSIGKPKRCLIEIKKMCKTVPLHDKKSAGIVRNTFAEVVADFRKEIYLSDDMKDALLLIFAVILSNRVFPDPYCPLWMFLVAPPGGGKTMLLQSAGDTDVVEFLSTMTPKTLISGYKSNDGTDLSLLPDIIGKTLIVKDWTGIMSLSSGEQDEIYGVLRDAYDGRVEKSFGHIQGVRVYPEPGSGHDTCHFTLLAGVTGAVHADRRANHGERFLKYQMMAPSGRDAINQIRAAISNTIAAKTPETGLRQSASSFIESKFEQGRKLATIPKWVEERIIGLGQIVSTVRAVVLRKAGELVVRPESEVASRISKQLIKLGQAVAFVLDKDVVDEECYRVMQRVGLDTCYGWHRDIIMEVAKSGKKGALKEDIVQGAVVSNSTTHRCLEDLFELGAIKSKAEEPPKGGKRPKAGQPPKRFFLSPFMAELFDRAKIGLVAKRAINKEVKDRSLPRKKKPISKRTVKR
jgi:hypothetical protein